MRALVVCLLSGLPFIAGCAGNPVERQEAIIGGTSDHSDPAVVKIQTIGGDGRYIDSLGCSGSLIAPNVVVTAAHCVPPAMAKLWRTTVSVGDGDAVLQVEEAHGYRPPALDTMTYTPDVGVFVTANALCPKPLPLAGAIDATLVGAPLRYVGFGVSELDGSFSLTKRSVGSTVSAVGDEFIESAEPGHGFCHGDSGGPLLVSLGGVETIAGVISRSVDCAPTFSSERVDRNASFLQAYLDNAAAAAPPCPMSQSGCAVADAPADLRTILLAALILVAIAKTRTGIVPQFFDARSADGRRSR
jgi:hypothetical protein